MQQYQTVNFNDVQVYLYKEKNGFGSLKKVENKTKKNQLQKKKK